MGGGAFVQQLRAPRSNAQSGSVRALSPMEGTPMSPRGVRPRVPPGRAGHRGAGAAPTYSIGQNLEPSRSSECFP
eukprot:3020957-Alexandrium_andersonii.AAC.1